MLVPILQKCPYNAAACNATDTLLEKVGSCRRAYEHSAPILGRASLVHLQLLAQFYGCQRVEPLGGQRHADIHIIAHVASHHAKYLCLKRFRIEVHVFFLFAIILFKDNLPPDNICFLMQKVLSATCTSDHRCHWSVHMSWAPSLVLIKGLLHLGVWQG